MTETVLISESLSKIALKKRYMLEVTNITNVCIKSKRCVREMAEAAVTILYSVIATIPSHSSFRTIAEDSSYNGSIN